MKTTLRTALAALLLVFAVSVAATPGFAGEPQKKCPIMGYGINKKLYADHNGKRVYFCCASCDVAFKKDPDKYIQQLEAKGVTLAKTP